MAILALNTQNFEILTEQMLDDICSAADGRYEIAWLGELPEERYEDVEIAFGAIPYETTTFMPRLKWLQLTTAGVDHCNDRRKYPHPNFQLTNANGAFGERIAEHVLAFFLGFTKGLHVYRDNQKDARWKFDYMPKDFAGCTVGVVGMGDIGRAAARKCSALGAEVLAIKRTPCKKPGYVSELFFDMDESLDDVLRRSDYVVLCTPLTENTRNMLDARRLALLRPGSVLVNVGRGGLIDQQALVERLSEGDIFAGLDVTTPEPLDADSPLWRLPNCWITPHVAGLTSAVMPYVSKLFVDNLKRYISGGRLHNRVDFDEGY